jgi:L-fuconolactonase
MPEMGTPDLGTPEPDLPDTGAPDTRAARPPLLVDAHVHVGLRKYRPVEDWLEAMDEHGITHAVLVQYIGNHDNAYLEECVVAKPERFAAVAALDAGAADAPAKLSELARRGLVRGIRLAAASRSAGGDPLALWRRINELGLVASVTGPFADVIGDDFLAVVDQFPNAHFRAEHLGWLRYADDPPPHHGIDRLARLARRPNTSTTWSGFFLNSSRPHPYPDAWPFLHATLEAFGPRRIMWSGDWNRPDLGPRDYQDAIDLVTKHLDFLSPAEREWILGRSAATLFNLGGSA